MPGHVDSDGDPYEGNHSDPGSVGQPGNESAVEREVHKHIPRNGMLEEDVVDGHHIRGYHSTGRTAPYFTRVLGVDGTERNWHTVLALRDLCAGEGSAAR